MKTNANKRDLPLFDFRCVSECVFGCISQPDDEKQTTDKKSASLPPEVVNVLHFLGELIKIKCQRRKRIENGDDRMKFKI